MKAAVLHGFKQPLTIEDVPRPTPGADDVLIQVEACGVCHSDLHVADGDWTQLSPIVKKPVVMGHEIAGRIVETGSNVRDLAVGDRVGVPWIFWTCGICEFCRQGDENLCIRQQITGVTVDGGYAQFVNAPATHVTKIPSNLSAAAAAPLFCAGVTVYRALRQSKIQPTQRLGIFGVGGLGHLAVQIGKAFGAEVTAIDISDEKLALAKALGASDALNAAAKDTLKQIRSKGGVHVAIVTSAARTAYDMAFACLRPTGTLMAVGLPAENVGFPPILMAAVEVRIQASAVGTRQDLREVLDLAAQGKIHCEVSARPLDDANDVLDELRKGKISGRVVLAPN